MTSTQIAPQDELKIGDAVDTPDGRGVVRNIVRRSGMITTLLVALDQDADRQPLWRAFNPEEVKK